jgi:hypothetical protein
VFDSLYVDSGGTLSFFDSSRLTERYERPQQLSDAIYACAPVRLNRLRRGRDIGVRGQLPRLRRMPSNAL